MAAARRLRELLSRPGLLEAPGVFDALSARLVERAGYEAAYVTGFGTAASVLAAPDTGLLTFKEMLDHATAIRSAVGLPLVVDADTGYGNAMNVYRTVRAYARAGFAAVQLEDQVWPKRCGHAGRTEVVGFEEARERIRAAVDARREEDIVIVARTDARASLGLPAALERCLAFVEEGADVIFLEAPASKEEMAHVAEAVRAPLLANLLEGGRTPLLGREELARLGYRIAIYPLTLLLASTGALLSHLDRHGADAGFAPWPGPPSFEALQEIVGFADYDRRRARYRDAAPPADD